MFAIDFAQANKTLGAPQGRESDVFPLPVFTDGQDCISCWKLAPEDIERIAKTGVIWLSINSGETQPPVMLLTEVPFITAEDITAIREKQDNEQPLTPLEEKTLELWLAARPPIEVTQEPVTAELLTDETPKHQIINPEHIFE